MVYIGVLNFVVIRLQTNLIQTRFFLDWSTLFLASNRIWFSSDFRHIIDQFDSNDIVHHVQCVVISLTSSSTGFKWSLANRTISTH